MKRHAKKLIFIIGLLIALAVWFYFTPHLTIRRMKQAAEKGDSAAFMSHVDLPALSELFRTNLTAAFVKTPTNKEMAAFQTMFVQPALSKAIEESLSPEKFSAQLMANARTNGTPPGRYLDLRTFGSGEGRAQWVFVRHGLATWKLSWAAGVEIKL